MTDEQSSTIRTIALCGCAAIGMLALCATLFWKNYADPSVLVAIISITGTTIGSLSGRRPPTPQQGNGNGKPRAYDFAGDLPEGRGL